MLHISVGCTNILVAKVLPKQRNNAVPKLILTMILLPRVGFHLFHMQGTILIAVNPLRRVPNPEMSEYMDRPLNPDAPHPYAIAEVCHVAVFVTKRRSIDVLYSTTRTRLGTTLSKENAHVQEIIQGGGGGVRDLLEIACVVVF